MNETSQNLTFWLWFLTGASGIITALVTIIYKFTHVKIDANMNKLIDYKEEVKAEFMNNDREHKEFWLRFNEAENIRQDRCVSRIEYEKDLKHITEAVNRIEIFTKENSIESKKISDLLIKHMGREE